MMLQLLFLLLATFTDVSQKIDANTLKGFKDRISLENIFENNDGIISIILKTTYP